MPNMSKKIVTATSHPNIALIKYWGKKDVSQNIPTNESLSISLPKLKTTTEISYTEKTEDEFFLDEKLSKINDKMKTIIKIFKEKANDHQNIKIISNNNFPHSCGLASSASGFSALVKVLNLFYQTKLNDYELTRIARFGSGSAARSIAQGVVKWKDEDAWKVCDYEELKIFVVILDNNTKKISSTEGMIQTVKTSSLFQKRLKKIEKKVSDAIHLIKDKEFEKLGKLVMQESNEFHATCLDSFPPIFYLSDKSKEIIHEVFNYNEKEFKLFYSFDAGTNPFIFVLKENYEEAVNFFTKKLNLKIIEAR